MSAPAIHESKREQSEEGHSPNRVHSSSHARAAKLNAASFTRLIAEYICSVLIIGATGSGKTSLGNNIAGLAGEVGSSVGATTAFPVFHPQVFVKEQGRTLGLEITDTVGLGEIGSGRHMCKVFNELYMAMIKYRRKFDKIILVIRAGKIMHDNTEQMHYFITELKKLGFTDDHFVVLLTHADERKDIEEYKKDLITHPILRALNLDNRPNAINSILHGVTMDGDTPNLTEVERTAISETNGRVLQYLAANPSQPVIVPLPGDKHVARVDSWRRWIKCHPVHTALLAGISSTAIAIPLAVWKPQVAVKLLMAATGQPFQKIRIEA